MTLRNRHKAAQSNIKPAPNAGLMLFVADDSLASDWARLVLAEKDVDGAQVQAIRPGSAVNEDFLVLNPSQSLPTLADREGVITGARVIVEYLDERYPHPPLMPIDPLSRARLRVAAVRIEKDWLTQVDIIQAGGRPADAARKRLREHLLATLPVFKASKFFLNPEMSLVDCLVAPVIWRLPWLQVDLGREGKSIIDYGERLFHSQGFARSMTDQERTMRQLHEQE